MKQRFTSLLLARLRQLIFRAPDPPPPAITNSLEDALSLDTEAMIKGLNDDLAALQAQMEEIDKTMKEADAVMQEMFDEWNDPTLSDEARAMLKDFIEASVQELTNLQMKAMEDLEIENGEYPLNESTPSDDLPEPETASQRRPEKRLYFSTPDHSSASSSPSEQRADCRRGS
jgi:hypothetical protein